MLPSASCSDELKCRSCALEMWKKCGNVEMLNVFVRVCMHVGMRACGALLFCF